jgi:hypothetical protein
MSSFLTDSGLRLSTPWFSQLTRICVTHRYELLRLHRNSACVRAGSSLLLFHHQTIVARTAWHVRDHQRMRLGRLIASRNQFIDPLAWLERESLCLQLPLDPNQPQDLETCVLGIVKEIDRFRGQLRANGIWHY